VEGDTLWHIKTGEWIVNHRIIPTYDFYSWTAHGAEWTAHEWLWEVIAYYFYFAFKKWGIWMLTCIGIILYAFSLFGLLKRRVSLAGASFLLIFALIIADNAWSGRPHVLAHGLFGLTVYLVFTGRENCKRLYLLPFIILFWANIHSSVPMGVLFAASVYVYSFFFSDYYEKNTKEHRILGVTVFLMLLTSFISQQGPGLWYYTFFASSDKEIINNITEWWSPDFHVPMNLISLLLMFLVFVLPLVIKKKNIALFELLFAAVTCSMWLYQIRQIPYFAFAGTLFLASALHEMNFNKKTAHAIAVMLIIVFSVMSVTMWPPKWLECPRERVFFPVKAVEFMKQHDLTKNVFNHYSWGGYLIWSGIPNFIDGRADMYISSGKEVFQDYLRIMLLRDEKNVKDTDPLMLLKKWKVQTILIPHNSLLILMLDKEKKEWEKVYEDKSSVIYVNKQYSSCQISQTERKLLKP